MVFHRFINPITTKNTNAFKNKAVLNCFLLQRITPRIVMYAIESVIVSIIINCRGVFFAFFSCSALDHSSGTWTSRHESDTWSPAIITFNLNSPSLSLTPVVSLKRNYQSRRFGFLKERASSSIISSDPKL